jgi:hypothetical protein
MKARLNLTIDDTVLSAIKSFAESTNVSISSLVEEHFKNLSAPPKRKNIIELVEQLPAPDLDIKDLKKSFYDDQLTKYGF